MFLKFLVFIIFAAAFSYFAIESITGEYPDVPYLSFI
jgi:hypothetical protein